MAFKDDKEDDGKEPPPRRHCLEAMSKSKVVSTQDQNQDLKNSLYPVEDLKKGHPEF